MATISKHEVKTAKKKILENVTWFDAYIVENTLSWSYANKTGIDELEASEVRTNSRVQSSNNKEITVLAAYALWSYI